MLPNLVKHLLLIGLCYIYFASLQVCKSTTRSNLSVVRLQASNSSSNNATSPYKPNVIRSQLLQVKKPRRELKSQRYKTIEAIETNSAELPHEWPVEKKLEELETVPSRVQTNSSFATDNDALAEPDAATSAPAVGDETVAELPPLTARQDQQHEQQVTQIYDFAESNGSGGNDQLEVERLVRKQVDRAAINWAHSEPGELLNLGNSRLVAEPSSLLSASRDSSSNFQHFATSHGKDATRSVAPEGIHLNHKYENEAAAASHQTTLTDPLAASSSDDYRKQTTEDMRFGQSPPTSPPMTHLSTEYLYRFRGPTTAAGRRATMSPSIVRAFAGLDELQQSKKRHKEVPERILQRNRSNKANDVSGDSGGGAKVSSRGFMDVPTGFSEGQQVFSTAGGGQNVARSTSNSRRVATGEQHDLKGNLAARLNANRNKNRQAHLADLQKWHLHETANEPTTIDLHMPSRSSEPAAATRARPLQIEFASATSPSSSLVAELTTRLLSGRNRLSTVSRQTTPATTTTATTATSAATTATTLPTISPSFAAALYAAASAAASAAAAAQTRQNSSSSGLFSNAQPAHHHHLHSHVHNIKPAAVISIPVPAQTAAALKPTKVIGGGSSYDNLLAAAAAAAAVAAATSAGRRPMGGGGQLSSGSAGGAAKLPAAASFAIRSQLRVDGRPTFGSIPIGGTLASVPKGQQLIYSTGGLIPSTTTAAANLQAPAANQSGFLSNLIESANRAIKQVAGNTAGLLHLQGGSLQSVASGSGSSKKASQPSSTRDFSSQRGSQLAEELQLLSLDGDGLAYETAAEPIGLYQSPTDSSSAVSAYLSALLSPHQQPAADHLEKAVRAHSELVPSTAMLQSGNSDEIGAAVKELPTSMMMMLAGNGNSGNQQEPVDSQLNSLPTMTDWLDDVVFAPITGSSNQSLLYPISYGEQSVNLQKQLFAGNQLLGEQQATGADAPGRATTSSTLSASSVRHPKRLPGSNATNKSNQQVPQQNKESNNVSSAKKEPTKIPYALMHYIDEPLQDLADGHAKHSMREIYDGKQDVSGQFSLPYRHLGFVDTSLPVNYGGGNTMFRPIEPPKSGAKHIATQALTRHPSQVHPNHVPLIPPILFDDGQQVQEMRAPPRKTHQTRSVAAASAAGHNNALVAQAVKRPLPPAKSTKANNLIVSPNSIAGDTSSSLQVIPHYLYASEALHQALIEAASSLRPHILAASDLLHEHRHHMLEHQHRHYPHRPRHAPSAAAQTSYVDYMATSESARLGAVSPGAGHLLTHFWPLALALLPLMIVVAIVAQLVMAAPLAMFALTTLAVSRAASSFGVAKSGQVFEAIESDSVAAKSLRAASSDDIVNSLWPSNSSNKTAH